MYILNATFYDLNPDSGEYTKEQTATLDTSRFYKLIFGGGETEIFPGDVDSEIPVNLNVHKQGGSAVECSVADNTLTIKSNYPGLGVAMLLEYADVIQNNTDVRSYVTNWLNPHPVEVTNWPSTYNVGNWPSSYTVAGTVSLSSDTISSLASAIASAINP